MKSRIIILLCSLSAVALIALAIVQINNSRIILPTIFLLLVLIPAYFLYSIFVLGRYKDTKKPDKKRK